MSTWRVKSACGGYPTRWFFDAYEDPETDERRIDEHLLALCRNLCGRCPVRVACYAEAMDEEGNAVEDRRHGIRGGITPEQRASLYRRFAVSCPDCGETFDPMSAVNGLLVCGCGEQVMWEVDDRGDQWLDRHSALASRVSRWLLERAVAGERVPSPTALAKELQVRKDDVIRVYRAAVRDGVLTEGEGRGVYFRGAGNHAVALWNPSPSRRH